MKRPDNQSKSVGLYTEKLKDLNQNKKVLKTNNLNKSYWSMHAKEDSRIDQNQQKGILK